MNLMFSLSLGLAVATSVFPAFAQESFTPINLAGTVIANNKNGERNIVNARQLRQG